MHELGLCEAVVEAICRRASGRPVSWARVRVGGHPVDPAVIEQNVAMAAAGTEAEGLRLEVVTDPLLARCRACGSEEPVGDATGLAACRHCGGVDVELVGADTAVLEAVGYRPEAAGYEPGATHADTKRAGAREEEAWTPSNS